MSEVKSYHRSSIIRVGVIGRLHQGAFLLLFAQKTRLDDAMIECQSRRFLL